MASPSVTLETFGAMTRKFRLEHREVLLTQDPEAMKRLAVEVAPLARFAKMDTGLFLSTLARRCLSDK